MTKLSIFHEMLSNNPIQLGNFRLLLNVNESMISYLGRHTAKMFIRRKSIRFCYKIWGLPWIDGYQYHLKNCQEKERTAIAERNIYVLCVNWLKKNVRATGTI